MARLWLLALFACAPVDPLAGASQLLALPPGAAVESPPAPAPRLERIETSACYPGRALASVSRELRSSLAAAGWESVELAATSPGRVTVTARRPGLGLGLTGVVEEGALTCAGPHVRVGAHVVPEGASRRTAGPGLRARISP